MRFSYLEIVIPELSVFVNKLFLCFETALIGDQPTMLSLNSIQSECCWHLCQSREPIKASWRRLRHTWRQRQSTPLPSAASSTLLFSSSWTEALLLLLMTVRRGWEDGERVHSCTVSLTLRLFIRMDGNVFPDQEQLLVFLKKLKEVFDVCDEDADGFIRVEHFVNLGLQFGQGDEVRTSLYISTHSFPSFWNVWLLMLQSTFVSYSLWD